MSEDRKKHNYPRLDDSDSEWNQGPRCTLEVGYGCEKYVSHAIDDFLELGFRPTHIWSSQGELQLEGEGVITPRVEELLLMKAQLLSQRCEFCWLGGLEKAVNGRCARHKDCKLNCVYPRSVSTDARSRE